MPFTTASLGSPGIVPNVHRLKNLETPVPTFLPYLPHLYIPIAVSPRHLFLIAVLQISTDHQF